ncbi:MAG: hypothetical protein COX63_00580, partial [Candidatus Diapherotrites archaeon CG_4_10_14_0_2_um_filter_31_5]
ISGIAAGRLGLELPEQVISANVKGIKIIFPNGKNTVLKEEGFVLEKDKFEQWIGKKAVKAGAKIKTEHKVKEIKKEGNFWEIQCSNKNSFTGKILIDASGVYSFTSKKLELNSMPKTVIGIQYKMTEIERNDFLDFYLWPKLAPKGYLWMIPKKNGKANIGLVTEEKTHAKKFLDEFLKQKKWENKKIEKSFGGLIPISGPHKKTFDDGLMLIGDAAGFTSPLFEGGTSLALTSAKFAGMTAKKAIETNDYSKKVLKEYEELWKKEFPDYNKLIKGKNIFYSFSEEELNFFSELLPDDLTKISFWKFLSSSLKLLIKKPLLVKKGAFKAAKAFSFSKAKHYGW